MAVLQCTGDQSIAEVTFLGTDALEDPETVMNEAIWRDQCPSIILHSAEQMGYPFSGENAKRNPEKSLICLIFMEIVLFAQSCSIAIMGKLRIAKMLIRGLNKSI